MNNSYVVKGRRGRRAPRTVAMRNVTMRNGRRRRRDGKNVARQLEALERRYVLDSAMVFNEIMYAPAGNDSTLEWIELHNPRSIDADISSWRIEGGIDFEFAEGTIVPGGGYVVVAKDPAALAAATGFADAVGPFSGQLANGGELLELYDRIDRLMNSLEYDDQGKFPVTPDESGASLAKIDPNGASDRADNWTSGIVVGGTPGARNFPDTRADRQVVTLSPFQSSWRYDASDVLPGSDWMTVGFDDQDWGTGDAVLYAGDVEESDESVLLEGVTAAASSQLVGFDRVAAYSVDGSGMSGDAHTITPDGAMWLSQGTFTGGTDPHIMAGDGLLAHITFDLGSEVRLDHVQLWNYNENLPNRPELLSRGIQRGDILVAGEDQQYTMFAANHLFDKGSGTQIDFSEQIDFGGIEVRYVRIDARSNFPGGDNNFVGLSEVRFYGRPVTLGQELPIGADTYYFRRDFQFSGDPSDTTLYLQNLVDDGAVVYLNGSELYRQNVPAGPVSHTTRATDVVGDAERGGVVELDGSLLVQGNNVLAVEVHQALADDPDMVFDLQLFALTVDSPPDELPVVPLVINEVAAGGADPFWFELSNTGNSTVDLTGFVVASSAGGRTTLDQQQLAAGEFLVVTQTQLGFDVAPGDRVFLYDATETLVLDGARVAGRLIGRLPGGGDFFYPDQETPGAENSFDLRDEIVINEILYHAPGIQGDPGVPPTYDTTEIVPFQSTWRYSRHQASGGVQPYNPGPNWEDVAHPVDALNWLVGPAPFGFDTTPAALPIPISTQYTSPLSNTNYITTYYFEMEFGLTQEEIDDLDDLALTFMIDDGAVFYLNGEEIHRFNMGAGVPNVNTQSSGSVDNAVISSDVSVDDSGLVALPAMNRFSVEVHQQAINSSDIVFDARLSSRSLVSPGVPATPYMDNDEEWIELYNRGDAEVDLSGWSLADGIDYVFPQGTVMGPGEYLVVSNDADALAAKYPNIRIVGDFSRGLSNAHDEIALLDELGNPADSVHYYEDGRWPGKADGAGSSLELRNPDADNGSAEAWSASDELSRSSWQHYEYEGVLLPSTVGPDGQWNELVIGLLDGGEVLLDNVSVLRNPGAAQLELVSNGSFEADQLGETAGGWRLIGNHRHSQVVVDPDDPNNQALLFVGTSQTEHMHNHGETTLTSTLQNGQTYRVSFDARWVSGSGQLNTRLYFNRLPRTTIVPRPVNVGTPGERNSMYEENLGPTYQGLIHSPAVPEPVEPVTVTVDAIDGDGIQNMNLWYSVNSGAWTSVPMSDRGDGRYAGLIPARSAGTIVQFYVQGTDSSGATTTMPRDGADSRALYQVNDGQAATNGLHNLRLILTPDDADWLHDTINLMSNDRVGATVIYDEHDIVYDAGIRLSGSERARPFTGRLSFNVGFPQEQLFRGAHQTMALDRSESTGFGQQEMVTHHVSTHVGVIGAEYNDMVHIITPRAEHTGTAEAQLARYTDVFLDSQFENGEDGMLFEYEIVYYPTTADAAGNKLPQPDGTVGTLITDLGDDVESYRWNFLIKNNRQRDDYSRLIQWAKVMGLTGQAFNDQVGDVMDVDQWLRAFAYGTISGAGDNFALDGSAHNAQFYARPEDGKMLYFPHDQDAFLNPTRPLVGNPYLTKLISVPERAHMYYGHVQDMLTTTYNVDYMRHFTENLGSLAPAQNFAGHLSFIGQRSNFLINEINNRVSPIAFSIQTPGPLDVGDSTTATVSGRGWVNVREIRLQGNPTPLNVDWTTVSNWATTLTVAQGTHTYVLEAYDFQGDLIGTQAIDITSSSNDARLVDALRITEIMYHPPDPTEEEIAAGFDDADDFEYVELRNVGGETINLFGARLATAVDYTFGNVTLEPGEHILVVENLGAFEARYGTGLNVAGQWSGALNNAGEELDLLDAQNLFIHSFAYDDDGAWPNRADGGGSSLDVVDTEGDYDDGDNWRSSTEYAGSPGAEPLGVFFDVVVNEVLTHTDPPALDSIELHNTSDVAVDIGGWYLSDERGAYRKFRIPDDLLIPGGGYVTFDEDDFNPTMGTSPTDFGLNSAQGDDVWLLAVDQDGRMTRFADHVEFGAAANGESFGRWPDGFGELYPMTEFTPGAANGGPRVGPLVISELMYHASDPDGPGGVDPEDLEYVEIRNPTPESVDLTDWRLTGGVDYEFDPGTTIPATGFVVVIRFNPDDEANADRLQSFRDHYGIDGGVTLVGGYSGLLSNGGDRVQLRRPDEPPIDDPDVIPLLLEDEVDFDDRAPWPRADGSGLSLTRLAADAWGNDPASWFAGPPTPGRVDVAPPRVIRVEINQDIADPPDLPGRPQPTDWATQRSDIRSIVVTFSRPVDVDAEDVQLVNLGLNVPAGVETPIDVTASHASSDVNVLRLAFGHLELPDGVYRLTILPSVVDRAGNPLDGNGDGNGGDPFDMSGNAVNRLFKLEGNWNGDTGISIFDFSTFSYWFGQSVGQAPQYVDLNDDLGISIFDFTSFAANFNVGVVFGAPLESVAGVPPIDSPRTTTRAESDRSADDQQATRQTSLDVLPSILANRRDVDLAVGGEDIGELEDRESLFDLLARDESRGADGTGR